MDNIKQTTLSPKREQGNKSLSTNEKVQTGSSSPSSRHTARPSTAQANEGIPSHWGYLSPQDRERIKRTHLQIARVCQSVNSTLGDLDKQEQGKAFLELALNRAKAPSHSQLAKDIRGLQGLTQTFHDKFLSQLDQVAQGKTAKVLLDVENQIVYKVIEVEEGLVGGTFPKEIRHRKEDDQILVGGCQKHSLLDCLNAIFIANKHGYCLTTEIAGFTEYQAVVLKQPYIQGLEPIAMFDEGGEKISESLQDSILKLNMSLVGDIGSPFAIGKVGSKLAIFDDLHGENILLDRNKTPFLVDSLATRYLKKNEVTLLQEYLIRKHTKGDTDKKVGSSKRKASNFNYLFQEELKGHLDLT